MNSKQSLILLQTNTDQPVAWDVWMMTIGVEGHGLETCTRGRCAKVRRHSITTPIATLLATITGVTRHEKAGTV